MKKLTAALLAALTLSIALLCGCSGGSAKPLSDVFADIKAEVSFSDFSEFSSEADLTNYGIDSADILEFAGGVNTTGVEQEEIVLVKAKDSAAADNIETALKNRYDAKLAQNKNYNPEQAEMIEKCSVEKNGDYVSMIVSENAEKITDIYKKGIGA